MEYFDGSGVGGYDDSFRAQNLAQMQGWANGSSGGSSQMAAGAGYNGGKGSGPGGMNFSGDRLTSMFPDPVRTGFNNSGGEVWDGVDNTYPVDTRSIMGEDLSPLAVQGIAGPMSYADQMNHVGQFLKNGLVGTAELLGGGLYNSGVRLASGAASVPYLLDSVDAAVAVQQGFKDRFGYEIQSSGAQAIGQALQPVEQWVQNNVMTPTRAFSESVIGDGATTVLGGVAQAGLEIAGVMTGGRAAASVLDNSVFVNRPAAGLYGGIPVDALFGTTRITTVTAEMSDAFQGMGYVNPLTNRFTIAPLGETMAVDHIFPSAEIVKLPGFNTLNKQQMTSIIQDSAGELGNLQPLPKSFNSSKGSDLNWTTYKGQALDTSYARDLRIQQFEIQQKIADKIRTYQQQNVIKGR